MPAMYRASKGLHDNRMTSAVRLLGAEPAIVGIRPEVAQTMVALNIDLSGHQIYGNLQESLASLLMR
jgi:rsbT co-antagonist protein RsbR